MAGLKLPEKLTGLFMKYRYALLILAVGLVFMSLPSGKEQSEPVQEPSEAVRETNFSQELAQILSLIQGAGKVEVILTQAEGERIVYQTDQDTDGNSNSWDTVTVTDADKNQTGLIQQVNPPTYLGAVVVCQGGDDPTVRLALVEAVSKVTGLGADKISVLKMK